ncbi:unnamed protein product [Moneuplotes crassus]|uniref:Uncharacterized protein n=1 Tax=Euplotes crassus TaxID=5936 RepID=A0AAD1XMT3_EUPCR|nr:unnamed protein product [Moneuplotes crassus]
MMNIRYNKAGNEDLQVKDPITSPKRNSDLQSYAKVNLNLPEFPNKRIIRNAGKKMVSNYLNHFSPVHKRHKKLELVNSKNERYFSPSSCIHSGRNSFMGVQCFTSSGIRKEQRDTGGNLFKQRFGNIPSSFIKQQFPDLFKPKVFDFTEESSHNSMNQKRQGLNGFKNVLRSSFHSSLKISKVSKNISPKINESNHLPREEFKVCFCSPKSKRSSIKREDIMLKGGGHPFKNSFLSTKLEELKRTNLGKRKNIRSPGGKPKVLSQLNKLFPKAL